MLKLVDNMLKQARNNRIVRRALQRCVSALVYQIPGIAAVRGVHAIIIWNALWSEGTCCLPVIGKPLPICVIATLSHANVFDDHLLQFRGPPRPRRAYKLSDTPANVDRQLGTAARDHKVHDSLRHEFGRT